MNANVNAGADALAQALIDNLHCVQAKLPQHATRNDWYMALAYTVRDRLLDRYITTLETHRRDASTVKVVAYLSAEFLTGPHLGNSLINLGIWDAARAGGVQGRARTSPTCSSRKRSPASATAASAGSPPATWTRWRRSNVPAIGYGIRYEFGIFDQAIRDGWQVELTDKWLRFGNPWEIVALGDHLRREVRRPHRALSRRAGPRPRPLAARARGQGRRLRHAGAGLPRRRPTNLLRLWKAEATESFDFEAFNVGDYYRAVDQKVASETITKVLYPNDEPEAGKQLRLAQQYFFVSCSLQDMIRLHLMRGKRARRVRRVLGRAAERHASVDRRRRADAAARRRARDGLGRRPGRSRSGPAATRTTRCWPRRSRSGRCRCSARCCRATSRSSTRSTAASSTTCGARYPGDDAAASGGCR